MGEIISGFISSSIALLMLYAGTLFDASTLRHELTRERLRAFAVLAAANYILVPVGTLAILDLLPHRPDVGLSLFIMAILPCAPLVPALVSHSHEPPQWALFVFFGFSALSFVAAALLATLLPLLQIAATEVAPLGSLMQGLVRFCGWVYVPLAAGASLRRAFPCWVLRWLGTLRISSSILLAVALTLSVIEHRDVLSMLSSYDVWSVATFETLCLLIALLLGTRSGGPIATRILAGTLRNFAMGVALSTSLFPHTQAYAYILFFSSVIVLITIALLGIMRMTGLAGTPAAAIR